MKHKKKNSYRLMLIFILIFVLSLLNISIKDYYFNEEYDNGRIDLQRAYKANADNPSFDEDDTVYYNEDKLVMPSGLPIGIYVKTKGVMVIDTGVIAGEDGRMYSPCKDILKQGDYVVEINGMSVEDKKSMVSAIDQSDGTPIKVVVLRDGENLSFDISPVKNSEGKYKLGLWVKDDISGIGTLTFVDEESFAALGHSINDNDTGIIFKISDGAVYNANLINIVKPDMNMPGRLEGIIDYSSSNIIGRITQNTEYGISGSLSKNYDCENLGDEWMRIATKSEVSVGPAYILSAITGSPVYYEINITNVNYDKESGSKSIELEITDPRLISLTDGIVQGMSGTPIIQNNRLIGAITHVFVNDSTKGYGIFIEYMLEKNDGK
ncbi:MAG: SpoIVB peptidase [Lachnospiraceae bacterium]|nr:SpoIVB peptidase [Lachnospiraceae bacterium]